ncbi:MAG: Cof subfamily protein (haloacid dehalogenase superfamily) [Psychromonas sp.]|jgi:Cof subfamily protein (haloacid dehalogenase superfamily)|uniref:Cof-type HAD-IIB family hydrolase n=1 Tax=Psychromonas sp. TaxID=1884585 RepID=UPI0039E44487
MYKIAASDLDGTLLTSEHKITPFTKQVLTQLHQQGTDFIFATGRHHVDVAHMREQLGIPAFMITSNGARVHNCENEIIFKQNIAPKIIKGMLKMLQNDQEIQIHLYRNDDWLVSREDANNPCKQAHFSYQLFDLNNPPLEDIAKIFITREDQNHEKLVIWENEMKAQFAGKAHITFSSPNCLEVMDAGVSKGHALDAIAKMKGYELKDCIAFGDGMNDFEMLSMAGKGLVMGSAHHKVKSALPDNEIIGHCDDDAVAHYLVKHLLE